MHALFRLILPFATLLAASGAHADPPTPMSAAGRLEPFSLNQVRLLPGSPFARAIEANRAYMLALEPDRLLAPYLRDASPPLSRSGSAIRAG